MLLFSVSLCIWPSCLKACKHRNFTLCHPLLYTVDIVSVTLLVGAVVCPVHMEGNVCLSVYFSGSVKEGLI